MKWKQVKSPSELSIKSNSWFFQMTKGWENETYLVLSRKYSEHITHAVVCRKDGDIVTWAEKQMIKNELFGNEMVAIEIYPKQSELIDDDNVYHLWLGDKITDIVLK